MGESDRGHSRIANNRFAVAVAVGSLLLALVLGWLYWSGSLEYLVPEHGPVADALPLYLLAILVVVGLAVWGWRRVLWLFR